MRLAVAIPIAGLLLLWLLAGEAYGQRIEVVARLKTTTTAPLPPEGRAGDADYQRWIVHDRYGRSIGDLLLDCRWVTVGLRLCSGQLSLPKGSLGLIGASRTRLVGQFAVVGGTGRYVGADGTLLFKATGNRRYVISIIYE